MRRLKDHYLIRLTIAFILAMLTVLMMMIIGCKKQPTIYDPDGFREEPKRTVSMEIHRVSDED